MQQPPEPPLSHEQQAPIAAALDGHSLLLTGGAGTGKSATLHALIKALRAKYAGRPGAVAVVAPTGVAALNVGGTTIHAWAKWAPMTREQATSKSFTPVPWRAVQVLVVDEVSMVSDWQLELMDRLGRAFRDKSKPFGGIQLVLCGDFLQLAPVEGALCFKSPVWAAARLQRFELTYAFRQGADGCFAAMLAEVRTGQPSDDTLAALQSGGAGDLLHDNIEPTLLYTTNAKVDDENRTRLSQLASVAKRFVAQDSGEKNALKYASAWTNAPDTLDLKLDAQVVLLRNLDIAGGLVNGSRGVVVGFAGTDEPVVRFACGATMTITRVTWTKKNDMERTVATRVQLPLALAWALTVHKAQGMSLDRVRVDLSGNFAPAGMAYVALSRCRTLAGLCVTGLTRGKICVDAGALAFYAAEGQVEQKRRKVMHDYIENDVDGDVRVWISE